MKINWAFGHVVHQTIPLGQRLYNHAGLDSSSSWCVTTRGNRTHNLRLSKKPTLYQLSDSGGIIHWHNFNYLFCLCLLLRFLSVSCITMLTDGPRNECPQERQCKYTECLCAYSFAVNFLEAADDPNVAAKHRSPCPRIMTIMPTSRQQSLVFVSRN